MPSLLQNFMKTWHSYKT